VKGPAIGTLVKYADCGWKGVKRNEEEAIQNEG
jgi:hypothetical protein